MSVQDNDCEPVNDAYPDRVTIVEGKVAHVTDFPVDYPEELIERFIIDLHKRLDHQGRPLELNYSLGRLKGGTRRLWWQDDRSHYEVATIK